MFLWLYYSLHDVSVSFLYVYMPRTYSASENEVSVTGLCHSDTSVKNTMLLLSSKKKINK